MQRIFQMKKEELKRAKEGIEIQDTIARFRRNITVIKSEIKKLNDGKHLAVNVCDCWIEAELVIETLSKQAERFEQGIEELEKKFDEL